MVASGVRAFGRARTGTSCARLLRLPPGNSCRLLIYPRTAEWLPGHSLARTRTRRLSGPVSDGFLPGRASPLRILLLNYEYPPLGGGAGHRVVRARAAARRARHRRRCRDVASRAVCATRSARRTLLRHGRAEPHALSRAQPAPWRSSGGILRRRELSLFRDTRSKATSSHASLRRRPHLLLAPDRRDHPRSSARRHSGRSLASWLRRTRLRRAQSAARPRASSVAAAHAMDLEACDASGAGVRVARATRARHVAVTRI